MDTENQDVQQEVIDQPSQDVTPEPTQTPDSEPAPSTATEMPEAKSLLDSLTVSDDEPEGGGGKEEQVKPTEPQAAKPEAPEPDAPKTPEQEEAELLEGVKSERGKARIKEVFAQKKALENDVREIQTMVQSSGLNAEEFAQHLEYGRLVSSGDEGNLRVALQMVEAQREDLCRRLGIEVPGVDALSDFPDLKSAVEGMEMTREHAVQMAKYRRNEQQKQEQQRLAQQQQAESADFSRRINDFQQSAAAYFNTRGNEVDFQAKMRVVGDYFKNPDNALKFVQTFQPTQWLAQLQFMYDNIRVAPQQQNTPQPLRSQSMHTGSPQLTGSSARDVVSGAMDMLGL